MITSEDNAGVPKFNSVKQYEEAFKLIISDVNNLKHENKCLRELILEMKKLMVATEHGVTPESDAVDLAFQFSKDVYFYQVQMEKLQRELKRLQNYQTARLTPESCDNRPECKHCNHSPVCKDELKQNLEGECPYYE